MARLKQRNLTAFAGALELLYSGVSADTLPERVLACIRSLFDCDFVSYSSVDLRQARLHAFTLAPQVPDWPGMEVYQRFLREDPAASHFMRTRDPGVVKMSDFVSLREYHSTSVYTEVFRRTGCDRRLGFAMQNVGPISLAATLNRHGKDFTDEDRTLFDLLRPHLLQANTQANAHRLLQIEQERQRENLGAVFGSGLGEIDEAGRVRWFTDHARALLTTFFPDGPHVAGILPDALYRRIAGALRPPVVRIWAELVRPSRFVWQISGPGTRTLKVRLIATDPPGHWQILLEEIDEAAAIQRLARALRLTVREAEAVHWLKQGKTNWEIAVILGITKKTVGKHFEHVYLKLGVENRTAVVRLALEACAEG